MTWFVPIVSDDILSIIIFVIIRIFIRRSVNFNFSLIHRINVFFVYYDQLNLSLPCLPIFCAFTRMMNVF